MLPLELFRIRNFAAANAATFLRLRGARRLARLHRPVHPVPRLLALRDEPDPRADHRPDDPACAALRRARRPAGAAPLPDRRPGAPGLRGAAVHGRRYEGQGLVHRAAGARDLLVRAGDARRPDHGHGAEVGAREVRRHRLRHQHHVLEDRQPARGRDRRPRGDRGLRGRTAAAPPTCRSPRTRPGRRSATPRSTPGGPAWRWSPRSRSPGAAVSAIFISNREARGRGRGRGDGYAGRAAPAET